MPGGLGPLTVLGGIDSCLAAWQPCDGACWRLACDTGGATASKSWFGGFMQLWLTAGWQFGPGGVCLQPGGKQRAALRI
jgi:hypothetical protein